MNIEALTIDELVNLRQEARVEKNWKLSDEIRTYLDSRHAFIIDTNDGQVIYHRSNGTREELIVQLKESSRAEKTFNSWLYSLRAA